MTERQQRYPHADALAKIPLTTHPGGQGTDTKKKCRIMAGYRVKPPRMEGDRWTVQQRGRNTRWETAITTTSEAFAFEWVQSRSPNLAPQLSTLHPQPSTSR